jgi:hypothetical protein
MLREVGVKAQVPKATPVVLTQLSVTFPANPFIGETVIEEVPDCPGVAIESGVAVIVNKGEPTGVTTNCITAEVAGA